MRKNILDQILAIIDGKVNKVEQPVDNLFGTIVQATGTNQEGTVSAVQQWYVVPLVSTTPLTLEQFVDKYTHEKSGFENLIADSGVATYRRLPTQQALMFITAIDGQGPFSLPITAKGQGYDISIYLDTTRVAAGRDQLTASANITQGVHFVIVLMQGGLQETSVTLPATQPSFQLEPLPAAPRWYQKPQSAYLTADQGTRVVKLQWNNDAFAGGWNIYRARTTVMGDVDVVVDNADHTFTVKFNSLDLTVEVGEDFYTNHFYGGKITAITKGLNGSIPYTWLTVAASIEAPTLNTDWEDEVYVKPGTFSAVTAVQYAGTPTISWEDSDVTPSEVYIYKITAVGFLTGSTESDYSQAEWAYSNDELAPGPIKNLVVQVGESLLMASYETPTDTDFAGVRVYGPYSSTPSSFTNDKRVHIEYGEASKVNAPARDTATFPVKGLGTYYFATVDSIGNEQTVGTSLSYLHDGEEDWDQPDLQVTVNDPTTSTQVLSWTSDGLVQVTLPAGLVYVFNTGSATSQTGQITITRDVSVNKDIVFTAQKYGVTLTDTVRVPAQHATNRPPNLNVVSTLANAERIEFTPTATDPRGGGALSCTATLTGVTADKRTGATITAFTSGGTLTNSDVLIVYRPRNDQAAGVVSFNTALTTGFEKLDFDIIQQPATDASPIIKFTMLDPVATGFDGDYEQRVQITLTNPSGGAITGQYKIGNGSFAALSTNPQTITFLRDNAPNFLDKVIVVKAINSDNSLEDQRTFIIDFDQKPEIVTCTVTPRFSGGQIVGWQINGSVDDDTNSVKAVLTSGVTFTSGQAAIISTDTTKTFTYNLDQGAGGDGKVTVTPYTDVSATLNAGTAFEAVLSRTPITTAFAKALSRTEFLITIGVTPSTATISYRKYRQGDTPPAYSTYTAPFKLSADESVNTVVEYYGTITGGFNASLIEEPNRLIVDPDSRPSVYVTAANGGRVREAPANVLDLAFAVDDDCNTWELFTRRGAYPTFDGTNTDLENQLDKKYSRGVFPSTITNYAHAASTGTWYIVVRGYDFNAYPGPADSTSFNVTGTATSGSGAELSNITTPEINLGGNNRTTELRWDHNSIIQSDFGGANKYKLDIYEAVDSAIYNQVASNVHAALEYTGSDTTTLKGSFRTGAYVRCNKGSSNCNYITYYWKIVLKDTSTSTVLQTYYAQRSVYGITLA